MEYLASLLTLSQGAGTIASWAGGLAAGLVLLFWTLREIQFKRKVVKMRRAFTKYVPADVVQLELTKTQLETAEDVEEITATVLFSDLEGFTHLSERLEARELVIFLNEYFAAVTDAITRNQGMVDKFIGDSVMAIWREEDFRLGANNAVRASLEISTISNQFSERARTLYGTSIRTRIGLNTGSVVFGQIGSTARLSYTAIGDQVNLASRLEGVNKFFKTTILISGSTAELVETPSLLRELEQIRVKGKAKLTRIYEVYSNSDQSLNGKFAHLKHFYEQALALYRNQQWDDAIRALDECLFIDPTDEPSRLLQERCRCYLLNSPEDWDGGLSLDEK